MFYISIKIEIYRKTGQSQLYACQRFSHGSSNFSHPLRCVKCVCEHNAKHCAFIQNQSSICCNCGGQHIMNFHRFPFYQHIFTSPQSAQRKNQPMRNLSFPQNILLPSISSMSKLLTTQRSLKTMNTHLLKINKFHKSIHYTFISQRFSDSTIISKRL